MVLAAVLRAARTEAGLTLRELARRVDVDASHLSRVEQGRTKPSKSLLSTLALALQIQEERVLTLGGYLPDSWQRQAENDETLAAGRAGFGSGGEYGHSARVAERKPSHSAGTYRCGEESLTDPLESLFPAGYLLSPEINEVYELKLAMLESRLLKPEELVQRGAYFVGIAGQPTNHFRICTGGAVQLPEDSGARLRSFLGTHRLKSSYATHGLFPYRGKFHPQMVKALLNVMGLRPGEVVLDPMAGSGTTAVEAALMGIDSLSVDSSPFCAFLAVTKVKALQADLSALRGILDGPGALDRVYRALGSEPGMRRVRDASYTPKGMPRDTLDLLALAFLDARGYGERSSRKTVDAFFRDILRKYVDTVERFQRAWNDIGGCSGGPTCDTAMRGRWTLPMALWTGCSSRRPTASPSTTWPTTRPTCATWAMSWKTCGLP